MYILLANVVGSYLQNLHVPHHTLVCNLHVYFNPISLDTQVVTFFGQLKLLLYPIVCTHMSWLQRKIG